MTLGAGDLQQVKQQVERWEDKSDGVCNDRQLTVRLLTSQLDIIKENIWNIITGDLSMSELDVLYEVWTKEG